MKNLRWRDIMSAKDREGREIVVLFVQGKGKSRKLVAPKSVGDYLERVRAISKATESDDRVFTNITGKPAKTLYSSLIADLLNEAKLREGTQGVPRSTYCFRHTYATLRLQGRRRRVFPRRADGNFRPHDRTTPRPRRRKLRRLTISPIEVSATSCADCEPPESRLLPEPLAEAGVGR